MPERIRNAVVALSIGISLLAFNPFAFADESLTITTYYPSPYGIYNELTTTGNTYLATTSGNVGIGTTSPADLLNVSKAGSGFNVLFDSATTDSTVALKIRQYINPYLGLQDSFVISQNGVGGVDLKEFRPANMAFWTDNIQRMTIAGNGNVGIGFTGASTSVLDLRRAVTGTTFNNGTILTVKNTTGASKYTAVHFSDDITSDAYMGYYSGTNQTTSRFFISGDSANENLVVSGAGNVGIGTTNPGAAKLKLYSAAASGGAGLYSFIANTASDNYGVDGEAVGSGATSNTGGYFYATGATSNYGVQIVGPPAGANNYAIRSSATAQSYFGGGIGIGINPGYQLQLSADSAAKPSTNTWTIVSDRRVKKDIRPYTNGLKVIKQIKPVWFKYNGKAGFPADNKEHIGVIGQEIAKVAPYTVNTFKAKLNPDDKKETELFNFNSHALTFDLINAVKELDANITKLTQENQDLKKADKELKSELENLKTRLSRLDVKVK